MVSLMRRPAGVSREEFQRWWREDHVPIARRIPGLRRYVLSFPADPDAHFDGMAELYFDDVAAARSCFASEEGRAAREDSLAHAGERITMVMAENELPVAPASGEQH